MSSPPPPDAHPLGLAIFSLLQVYSPPLGMQKETIPLSELLFDLIYIFCYIFLIHTKAKQHVFTTFMSIFLSFLVKDMDVIMKMKTKKKNSLKSDSLIEHFIEHWTESLFLSKYQKPCICFHIKTYHYLKLS